MFKESIAIAVGISVTIGALSSPTFAAQVLYAVNPISTEANGISNSGIVIIDYGAMWTAGAGLQSLGLSPLGISSAGTIAGSMLLTNGAPTRTGAGIWQNGQTTGLPALRAGAAVEEGAMSVNDLGTAVGYSDAGPGDLRAVRWTNGSAEDLGDLLGADSNGSVARGINNAGQVILTTNSESQIQGARDDKSFLLSGTSLTAITSGAVNVTGVHATSINAGGQIAGSVAFADGTARAFIWSSGQMVLTPDLFPAVPGSEFGSAINDQGFLVGTFSPNDNGPATAFLWDGVNSPVDLNSMIPAGSGWYLFSATGIDADGDIVGNGLLNGTPAGFLLTPKASFAAAAPEPATAATLLLAGTLLLRRNRRRI